MLHPYDGLHHSQEFTITLELTVNMKPLDCNSLAFRECCQVHSAKATITYDVNLTEVVGSFQDII
jgi:hypothetical protein